MHRFMVQAFQDPPLGSSTFESYIVAHLTSAYCPLGYFMSCITPNAEIGLALAPPLVIPFLLFGGFFLNTV
jgi:hypothetical protein